MGVTIDEILVGDPQEAWEAAGFTVDDDGCCRVGAVRVRLVGREAASGSSAGRCAAHPPPRSPTACSTACPPPSPTLRPWTRPCTPTGPPTSTTSSCSPPICLAPPWLLGRIGLEPRGERESDTYGAPMKQVFFRLGEVILELIGQPGSTGEGAPGFFGLAITVDDLDGLAVQLGERLGTIKDAVQEGRRIATLRHRDLGMSVATAFMSPEPG